MNRSRRRRKRLGLPPYGTNVMGVDIPNKMQKRLGLFEWRIPDGDHCAPTTGYWSRRSLPAPDRTDTPS